MQLDEQTIRQVVARVVAGLPAAEGATGPNEAGPSASSSPGLSGLHGVFATVDEAVSAAREAQCALVKSGLECRGRLLDAMRSTALTHAEALARLAVAETGIGRYEHKVLKNQMAASKSPGAEDLPIDSQSGTAGLTVVDGLPFGVICAIAPITNPTSTIINNGIIMLAAGNTVMFCPHPNTARCTLMTMSLLNDAIVQAGGPRNCMTAVAQPTIRTAQEAMAHRGTSLIVATGGPAVVRAALEQRKRAICAGPGNPPVLVDETADLRNAARSIVAGCGFDNNLPCIGEKSVAVVEGVAGDLIRELKREGGFEVQGSEAMRLAQLIMKRGASGKHEMNRDLIGKNASVILRAAGISAPEDIPIAFFETGRDDPCVIEEQLMPILPIVRVRNFEDACAVVVSAEGGRGHTVIIHSQDMGRVTALRARVPCTVFVVNGPSYAGDGVEGEGHLAMTVAGYTGEGFTRPRTFLKERRTAVGNFLKR